MIYRYNLVSLFFAITLKITIINRCTTCRFPIEMLYVIAWLKDAEYKKLS